MSNSKPNLWEGTIPKANKVTIVICFIALFVSFSVASSNNLMDFFVIMVGVFVVYILFFLIEARLAGLYKDAAIHPADKSIKNLIIYRNFVVILNVTPGIQLIGFLFIPTFVIWLPWYVIKLFQRSK